MVDIAAARIDEYTLTGPAPALLISDELKDVQALLKLAREHAATWTNQTKNLWKLCAVASNRNIPGRADHKRPSQQRLLRPFSVRAHRSEIMFGVLVVVLCPDRVADLGFITSERQIPLIVSLRVLRALRLGAGGTRCPPLRACGK